MDNESEDEASDDEASENEKNVDETAKEILLRNNNCQQVLQIKLIE